MAVRTSMTHMAGPKTIGTIHEIHFRTANTVIKPGWAGRGVALFSQAGILGTARPRCLGEGLGWAYDVHRTEYGELDGSGAGFTLSTRVGNCSIVVV